jgi:hypothetical protein
MTNAELEVIEVAFIHPPLEQIAMQSPGISSIILPITPDSGSNITGK